MKGLWLNCLLVGAGGFAGSAARYLLALALQRYALFFPAGTLAANLGGCLVVGMIAQAAVPASLLSPESRLLLAVGFCGGFTTMSSLIYELARFVQDGEYWHAGGYLAGTLAGCAFCFVLGAWLMRMAWKSTGGVWN